MLNKISSIFRYLNDRLFRREKIHLQKKKLKTVLFVKSGLHNFHQIEQISFSLFVFNFTRLKEPRRCPMLRGKCDSREFIILARDRKQTDFPEFREASRKGGEKRWRREKIQKKWTVEAWRRRRSLFGNGGSGRGRVFEFFELSPPNFSELINAGRSVTTGSNFSLMNHGGAARRISRLACPSSPLLNITTAWIQHLQRRW